MTTTAMDDKLGPFATAIPCVATAIVTVVVRDSRRRGNPLLAAFLAIWFMAAFFLAIQDPFLTSPTQWSKEKDFSGFVTFAVLCIVPLYNFHIVYSNAPPLRDYVLHDVPAWSMIGLQAYRLAGSCFLYMYFNGSMRNYAGLQTGILDIVVGVTAIPLALLVKSRGLKSTRNLVLAWNAIGLYDLLSAFALYGANYFGYFETELALSIFAFYPVSLIALFQVPLAMGIHVLFLASIDQMGHEDDGRSDDEKEE